MSVFGDNILFFVRKRDFFVCAYDVERFLDSGTHPYAPQPPYIRGGEHDLLIMDYYGRAILSMYLRRMYLRRSQARATPASKCIFVFSCCIGGRPAVTSWLPRTSYLSPLLRPPAHYPQGYPEGTWYDTSIRILSMYPEIQGPVGLYIIM